MTVAGVIVGAVDGNRPASPALIADHLEKAAAEIRKLPPLQAGADSPLAVVFDCSARPGKALEVAALIHAPVVAIRRPCPRERRGSPTRGRRAGSPSTASCAARKAVARRSSARPTPPPSGRSRAWGSRSSRWLPRTGIRIAWPRRALPAALRGIVGESARRWRAGIGMRGPRRSGLWSGSATCCPPRKRRCPDRTTSRSMRLRYCQLRLRHPAHQPPLHHVRGNAPADNLHAKAVPQALGQHTWAYCIDRQRCFFGCIRWCSTRTTRMPLSALR